MRELPLSTAYDLVVLMIDSTDHITGKTGLTLTIDASKAGAAFANITPTVTELSYGFYKIALTTTHTNTLGDLALHITATGADPTDEVCKVVSSDQLTGLYQDGAVWVDTVNGTAGTTLYYHGIATRPVAGIADALTIAAALKLTRIHFAPGSSVTLAATVASYELYGVNWTLALGSQSISGSRIIGATVSGTGTGSTAPVFENCVIGTCTLPPCRFRNCLHTNTITMGSAGDFALFDCRNAKTAGSAVQITCTANSTLKLHGCFGYFQVGSGANTNTVEWHGGAGKYRINATCNGLISIVSGMVELDDLGTSSVTTDTSRWNEDQNISAVTSCGYEEGAVWISSAGTAGTEIFVNGTASYPVDNIADALTLAGSLNINKIKVAPGTSITLAAALSNYDMYGENWTLALGGQNIQGSRIRGATVTGTATSSGNAPVFENCIIGAATLPTCWLKSCTHVGTLTMGSTSGTYMLLDCQSANPSAGNDIQITFAANSSAKLLECRGYFSFGGAASGNTLIWHGSSGRALIRNTCTSLTAYISGNIELTDQGTTSSISDNARYDVDQPVGDVSGKVLGGGSSTITDVGAWVLNDAGDPIESGGGGAPVGPGGEEVIIVSKAEGNPIDGVDVWITTDIAGTDTIAGTLVSDNNGITTFMLDPGMTYYVWRQRAGVNWLPNPEAIDVP